MSPRYNSLPQSDWEKRALSKNLTLLSQVQRSDMDVKVKCLNCGLVSTMTPARITRGTGCPKCARLASRVKPEKWLEFSKKLQFRWVTQPPESLADKKKKAICDLCGKTWVVTPRSLYRQKMQGHPKCPNREKVGTVSRKEWETRLRAKNFELLSEPINSKSKAETKCLSCGLIWMANPGNIWYLGSGCPKCSIASIHQKKEIQKSLSDAERIKLITQKALEQGIKFLEEDRLLTSRVAKAECIRCGHQFSPYINTVVAKGTGCPKCAGNVSLDQSEWAARAEAVGLIWLESVTKRHAKFRAECKQCGTEGDYWASAVARGSGCAKCGAEKAHLNRRLDAQIWIDRALNRQLEWVELPTTNSQKKRIRCLKCAYEWLVSPISLAGCPSCAGVLVTTEMWQEKAAAKKLVWLEEPSGARIPVKVKCLTCSFEWSATPSAIANVSGCPACAEYGFNPKKPAYLYFIEDPQRGVRKVGIANEKKRENRLIEHQKNGFTILHLKVSHESGALIAQLESEVLDWIRNDLMLPQASSRQAMPQRGWTETFPSDDPSNKVIKSRITRIYQRLS